MGVYINMEMPRHCPCELVGIGYDMCCSFVHGIPARVKEYDECCEKKIRPDWCLLNEVPEPHGRLIDADALPISTATPLNGKSFRYVHINNINNAPTIIPASKRENDE